MMEYRRHCTKLEQEQARARMNYWKKNRSVDHVFASELAFSLIYDNVKAEEQERALATMGLAVLPDVMLLVQVDNYVSKYSDMKITHEFFIKAGVRNCLQTAIDNSDYAGFAANLVGLDTLVCFLCLPEEKDRAATENRLFEFADFLRQVVEHKTNVSVTICISEFCSKIADYPPAYTKARDMLYGSFYLGKNASVVSARAAQQDEEHGSLLQFMDFYPAICVALSNGDVSRFETILIEVGDILKEQRVFPKQSKNNLAGLIHTLEVYAQNCGLENKSAVAPVTAEYAELILRSGYLEDAVGYLKEYFVFLNKELKKVPNRDQAQAFREPIVEYIKNHFGEEITLNELSEMTGYSTYYFTRVFKKNFGCTMTEYLTRYRIEQSKEMLKHEHIGIGETAVKCGFESANYFSSCFRGREGLTPSQYRKQFGK